MMIDGIANGQTLQRRWRNLLKEYICKEVHRDPDELDVGVQSFRTAMDTVCIEILFVEYGSPGRTFTKQFIMSELDFQCIQQHTTLEDVVVNWNSFTKSYFVHMKDVGERVLETL